MARKRRKRTKKDSFFSSKKYLILSLLIFIILFILGVLGVYLYKLGFSTGYTEALHKSQSSIAAIKKKEKDALKHLTDTKLSEIEDFEKNAHKTAASAASSMSESSSSAKRVLKHKEYKKRKHATYLLHKGQRPKLVLILDDVAYRYQVNAIKRLGLKITPSFFPPTPRHPNTWKYAKEFRHYMIHLPMEATNFPHEEYNTLHTNSSKEFIERVVASLRERFPHAKFINNHTGSKFTADAAAMNRLIPLLNKYGFIFVDSRTTPNTVVKSVVEKYGYPYIARNIFLDNEQNVSYIRNQLKKAVHIAKRNGYAIAIGHPHQKTLQALARSKDILKDVQLIYIDDLYTKAK
ncbi:divergent polysaccharide deacetylase family protein [Nitratiruptor tergarcus]|uniref:Divergent polysaccharide deacetylase n=1 Tax=Nitratiruptor tergarcus DSM 16512 TaxID=1069081 RepID=A0A1W1WT53_9BACT|nr:divergent polysaccharide deacetylase family protein [Nitratiruptor tergarcus]SMC09379.1 hypothetical protein SAMN05660197_1186 [Nitratiruptor tergarcus DSM 16512]